MTRPPARSTGFRGGAVTASHRRENGRLPDVTRSFLISLIKMWHRSSGCLSPVCSRFVARRVSLRPDMVPSSSSSVVSFFSLSLTRRGRKKIRARLGSCIRGVAFVANQLIFGAFDTRDGIAHAWRCLDVAITVTTRAPSSRRDPCLGRWLPAMEICRAEPTRVKFLRPRKIKDNVFRILMLTSVIFIRGIS